MDLNPVLLFAVVIVLIWLFNSLNVLREYERGVIFRVGRLLPEPKGPGLIWVLFPIDRIVRVSLRTITMDVPTQDVITKDNVSVKVNAVQVPKGFYDETEGWHITYGDSDQDH